MKTKMEVEGVNNGREFLFYTIFDLGRRVPTI